MTVLTDAPVLPAAAAPATTSRPFHVHGRVLTVGAGLWSLATAFTGVDPGEHGWKVVAFCIGSAAFQLGLLALLRVLYVTSATGTGRFARGFLRFETGLVLLAIGSTLADGFGVSDLSAPGWAALDACWPFSMLGMFALGIRVAVAGRWTGVRRVWPLLAESWAVVTIPSLVLFGETAATVVSCVHLLVGYATLGVLVSRKQR